MRAGRFGFCTGALTKAWVYIGDCTSSTEALPRAEPGETQGSIVEGVSALRMWLDSMPHLTCRNDAEFLLRFLRVAKFDQDRAQMMLDNYITIRRSRKGSPQWFQYPDLASAQMLSYLQRPFLHLRLGYKANGEAVYLSAMQFWDPASLPFDQLITTLYMTADVALVDRQSQISGVTVLVDLAHTGAKQLGFFENRRTFFSLMRNWQDAFPVKIKSVIYLNESRAFDVLFALIKGTPIIKKKIRDRLHRVGDDLDKLRRLLGTDEDEAVRLLPSELGGSNGTMEQLMAASQRLFHSAEVQEEWRLMRQMSVDETQRPESTKHYLRTCTVI